jgi:polysaccharide biosynthesis protein VpsM
LNKLDYMIWRMNKQNKYIIIVLLFLCPIVFASVLDAYQRNATSSTAPDDEYIIRSEKEVEQVGAFRLKKNAEKLVKKLRDQGVKAHMAEGKTKDNQKIYRVYVRAGTPPTQPSSPLSTKETKSIVSMPAAQDTSPDLSEKPVDDLIAREGNVGVSGTGSPVASLRYFTNKQIAEQYSEELTTQGFKTDIKEAPGQDGKTTYMVFSEKSPEIMAQKPLSDTISNSTEKSAGSLLLPSKRSLLTTEPTPPESKVKPPEEGKSLLNETPAAPPKEQPVVPVAAVITEGTEAKPAETKAAGETGITASKAFGGEGGYIHPFVGFQTFYTDNVYNSEDDKESDFMLLVTPGVWLTVPRINQKLLKIDSANVAPGGFIVSRLNPSLFRRYQTYLYYGADIELFAQNSSQNTVSHRVEGLFQYNLKGGVTLEVMDKYLMSHDVRGTGVSDKLDKFNTNLGSIVLYYDTRSKMQFRVDYTNFLVNYDAARNKFRDRHDNAFSGYSFYKVSPKTSLFVEYDFIDIGYESDSLSNSKEHHFWGGIDWNITAKSTGRVKAGYGIKDFSRSSSDDAKDFIFEAQIDHKFTPKTSIVLKALRKTNETNITTTDYMITTGGGVDYLQRITGRLFLSARLAYWNELYQEDLTYQGDTKEREDDIWEAGIALRYDIKEWLKFDIGYLYTNRDSNFSEFDYTTNSVFFGLKGDFSLTP